MNAETNEKHYANTWKIEPEHGRNIYVTNNIQPEIQSMDQLFLSIHFKVVLHLLFVYHIQFELNAFKLRVRM